MKYYTNSLLGQNGRLGNQLWTIAWQIGQAYRNGGRVAIPHDWPYRKFFSIPDTFFQPPGENIEDAGAWYYQELEHWIDYRDKIWGYFQPSEHSFEAIFDQGHPEWLLDDSPKCSIHVRRGDYLNQPTLFPALGEEYYSKAKQEVLKQSPARFVVFSDDIEWCRNNMEADHFVDGVATPVEVVDRVNEPQDVLDLFLMASMGSHIIANSTFSWWGAYLSDSRHTVYPSVWWGPGLSDIRDVHQQPITESWRNAMPTDWTEIPC